jgi:hypothetical protein
MVILLSTREVVCQRCGNARWRAAAMPYTCQRCQMVLAGKPNVIDPKAPEPSPAQLQNRIRFGQQGGRRGVPGPGHTETAGGAV